MTDSPRREGHEPAQPYGDGYPGYTDPAYADQAPYGPTYQAPATPAPTERLPEYSAYGYDPYATGQYGAQSQPPPPPARWTEIAALAAVDAGRDLNAGRGRPGDRVGHRQQLQPANGCRAAAAGLELHDA